VIVLLLLPPPHSMGRTKRRASKNPPPKRYVVFWRFWYNTSHQDVKTEHHALGPYSKKDAEHLVKHLPRLTKRQGMELYRDVSMQELEPHCHQLVDARLPPFPGEEARARQEEALAAKQRTEESSE
jgi:hypothetical protein